MDKEKGNFNIPVTVNYGHNGKIKSGMHGILYEDAGTHEPIGWSLSSYFRYSTGHHTVSDITHSPSWVHKCENVDEYFSIRGLLRRSR